MTLSMFCAELPAQAVRPGESVRAAFFQLDGCTKTGDGGASAPLFVEGVGRAQIHLQNLTHEVQQELEIGARYSVTITKIP